MRLKIIKAILCLLLFFFSNTYGSTVNNPDEQITQLLAAAPKTDLNQRINYFSKVFLNHPYLIEPLGEGKRGEFNQAPLYRLDYFDCQTYVETVIALSLAHNLNEFKSMMIKIRYKDGIIDFTKRNHFPTADWVPNNINNGFVENITEQIAANNTLIATAYINRQNWYKHLTLERINIPTLSPYQKHLRLAALRGMSDSATNTWASISYISKNSLLINNLPNYAILNKIPNGTIILIVTNKNLIKKIGTQMNITHMGLAIWHNQKLYFRNASTILNRVVDIPFSDYLMTEPNVRGLSVLQIRT